MTKITGEINLAIYIENTSHEEPKIIEVIFRDQLEFRG